MHRLSKLATATGALVLALSACQTTPGLNSDLTQAQATVERARSNAYVARSAAVELERAQQALAKAQSAWAADRDTEETRHLAYLAAQRAEIALALGERAQADERIEQAGTERERVRLQARTREADAATRAAQEAQATARQAQSAARTAQGDAMQSREQAESARLQAEAARAQAEAARVQASQQASRADNLERDLQDLRGRKTDRGMVVTLGDVLFESGSANLNGGAQRSIDQLIQVLRQYPERKVRIEGYTDSVGSDTMNMQLSQRRAEAFARALVGGGIAANRIDVRAWGEANPVSDNSTAAGRQQNRRVEVLFSDPAGRFAGL